MRRRRMYRIALTTTALTLLFAGSSGAGRSGDHVTAKGVTAAATCSSPRICMLTVSVSGSGTVTYPASFLDGTFSCTEQVSPCVTQYQPDTPLTLTEKPGSGYLFAGWGGACSGTASQCALTMNSDLDVSADFAIARILTVTLNPTAGGSVGSSPAGISCPSVCRAQYGDKTTVTLTATAAQSYVFTGWQGACSTTNSVCSVVMDANKTVTANFAPAYSLTTSVPNGGGTVSGPGISCPGDCSESYTSGTQVSLTATAAQGYVFDTWSGAAECAGSTNTTCTVTMNSDKSVAANFVRVFTLTVTVDGGGKVAGAGIDCPGTCTQTYKSGTKVALSEVPDAGAGFSGWDGACAPAGSGSSCDLVLDGDKSVKASFAALGSAPAIRYTLTVDTKGPGRVIVAGTNCRGHCTPSYPAGTTVRVEATADTGVNFRGWGGACKGFGTCALVMSADKSLTASFSTDPVIADQPEPAQLPAPTKSLSVNISGEGAVTTLRSSTRSSSLLGRLATGRPTISCSDTTFACYTEGDPSSAVTLKATPAKGQTFKGWEGAPQCGAATTCTVPLSQSHSVTARFGPAKRVPVEVALKAPLIQIGWKASSGRGSLVVTGRVSKSAKLVLDLRRPNKHAGPLLRRPFAARGAFRHRETLPSRLFPKGARLLPGGFVVSIRGKSGRVRLPLQLRTAIVPAPFEGVVRLAFASATRNGKVVKRLPSTSREAWANFRFAAQPRSLDLLAAWYLPNGKLLGSIKKSNRPVVSTFIRSASPLPSGAWRVELYAGPRLVKRQLVRIG